MKKIEKEIREYLGLPWENEFKISRIPENEGGGFKASIPLLGENRCVGDGDTVEEAIANLREVLEDLLEDYLQKGWEIPKPKSEEGYSGTIIVRTTRSIHARLSREAKNQGVSLNYLIGLLLEKGLAHQSIQASLESQEIKKPRWNQEALDAGVGSHNTRCGVVEKGMNIIEATGRFEKINKTKTG